MKRKFDDHAVKKCNATNRDTTDLWEIRTGGVIVTTVRGQEEANILCAALNEDPYFLDRGQDRMSRGGAKNYARKD